MAERGMKCDQLIAAAKLPLSRPQLSNIINGHMLPTPPVLYAICEALDTAPCELYDLKTIDLVRVQQLWDKRHGEIKRYYGNEKVSARMSPADKERLNYVIKASGHTSFREWLLSTISAEYAQLRTGNTNHQARANRSA